MSANAFEELEKKYNEIVDLMPDDEDFDSHDFILKLAQKYQQLYVQALKEYANNNQPFQTVHGEIVKRLKKREDLVKQVGSRYSLNIFGLENEAAVWRKVKWNNFVERLTQLSFYAVAAAGIVKAGGSRSCETRQELHTRAISEGLLLVTFTNYAPPDGTFGYILKAIPFVDAATREKHKLVGPVIVVDSFTIDGIQLFITDQGVPLKVTALKAIELILEINLYRIQ